MNSRNPYNIQLTDHQAAEANELVFVTDVSLGTALAWECFDGWRLALALPDGRWCVIRPDGTRSEREHPDSFAVWAGITAQYIGEGEACMRDAMVAKYGAER